MKALITGGAVAAPIVAYALGMTGIFPYLVANAALVVWLHRANVGRLVNGTEPKIGGGKE